jgi:hypothetical protein
LQEFSDARDADDARYNLDGRDFDGSRMIVEFAKGVILMFLTYDICLRNDADFLFSRFLITIFILMLGSAWPRRVWVP